MRLSEYNFKIEYQKGQDNVIADVLSRLPFATAQAATRATGSTQDPGVAPRDSGASDLSTTSKPNIDSTFMLPDFACRTNDLDLELEESEDDTSDTDSECEDLQMYGAEDLDLDAAPGCPSDLGTVAVVSETANPLIDLPISRDGLTAVDFIIPTREEFAAAQSQDPDLQLLRTWLEEQRTPTADDLAPHSGRVKTLAQLREQVSMREGVLVVKRLDDLERELIIVPCTLSERIIQFYHEGPRGAHQAAQATTAKSFGLSGGHTSRRT